MAPARFEPNASFVTARSRHARAAGCPAATREGPLLGGCGALPERAPARGHARLDAGAAGARNAALHCRGPGGEESADLSGALGRTGPAAQGGRDVHFNPEAMLPAIAARLEAIREPTPRGGTGSAARWRMGSHGQAAG